MEGVPDVSYELWYIFEIEVYQIPMEPGQKYSCQSFFQWNRDCVLCGLKKTVIHNQQWYTYLIFLWCVGWMQVCLNEIISKILCRCFLDSNMSLWIVIIYLLHQCFNWTHHDHAKYFWKFSNDYMLVPVLFNSFFLTGIYVFHGWYGIQPKMSPMISLSGIYRNSFIYCRNRTSSQ